MKKIVVALFIVLGVANVNAWAQNGDFFGGFSILSTGGVDRTQAYGWQASVAANPSANFGVVGDFGGQYRDGNSAYQYLFGPRYTARGASASAFVHALFGGARFGSGNNFAMAYGGGIDVPAGDGVAVRVIQFDWVPVRAGGSWNKETVRFGFGLVFPFGQ